MTPSVRLSPNYYNRAHSEAQPGSLCSLDGADADRLLGGSGVSREAPAPFCERPEVKLLRPTRPTFEEARRHLGLETQRQWSDLAILRTTPALLGLISLVTLWATQLEAAQGLRPECVRWYPKHAPTFSDALALVRRELWTSPKCAPRSSAPGANRHRAACCRAFLAAARG